MAHGLDTLIEAASTLQRIAPRVSFLLVGEGADKERVQATVHSRGLGNICFVDQQPREMVPAFICASDVCLVLLKKTDLFKTVIPTKMLEFMSCARPVILGVDGQARQILEEARAAWSSSLRMPPRSPRRSRNWRATMLRAVPSVRMPALTLWSAVRVSRARRTTSNCWRK